jgi:AAHS family 4-hydroxybenzoate transporter-like MFS transporter
MPALPFSTTEAALENQRFGGLQLKVAILCGLTQAFDGYDLNSIGMAAPSLAHAWNVPPAAFASAFVMSSVGIMVGALSAGPLGDRLGRKPVIIAGLLFIGLFSLASAYAGSLLILTVLRFFTGIGIGALMPATVALSSDYAPERMRAVVIMLVFVGNPIGAFLGGQLIAQMLPLFGWPSIFIAGGILPLALIPVQLLWLPESPRFLLRRGHLTPRQQRLVRTLNIEPAERGHAVDIATGNPVAGLFRDGLAPTTLLVWVLFFANLLSMFMISYWLPTVLHLSGFTPAGAVFAASMQAAGGIIGTLMLGALSLRFGASRVISVSLAGGVLMIGAIGLLDMPYIVLLAAIFCMGSCTVGSQTAANGMVAALYPARVRTTGMGWALGIGRLGAIGGPALGGLLLGLGWPPRQILLCACVTALIATTCTMLLRLRVRRRAPELILRQT